MSTNLKACSTHQCTCNNHELQHKLEFPDFLAFFAIILPIFVILLCSTLLKIIELISVCSPYLLPQPSHTPWSDQIKKSWAINEVQQGTIKKLVIVSPVVRTGKELQPNWTATGSNWTSSCSHWFLGQKTGPDWTFKLYKKQHFWGTHDHTHNCIHTSSMSISA